MISEQVRSMRNGNYEMLPALTGMGKDDSGGAAIITNFNTLLLRMQRDESLLGANSPALKDLKAQISIAYRSVITFLEKH